MSIRSAALSALLVLAACGAGADVAQVWWDPDDGPPTTLAAAVLQRGETGTLWLVARVGGVAYVCEIMSNGWEGLVEVQFNSERIGYPPNPKTQERRCDNKWRITGPDLSAPPAGYDLPRLRIEVGAWKQET